MIYIYNVKHIFKIIGFRGKTKYLFWSFKKTSIQTGVVWGLFPKIKICKTPAVFFVIANPFSKSLEAFNKCVAECFNPDFPKVNIFQEWPAFDESCSDGYCYDNQGKQGFKVTQIYNSKCTDNGNISCGGCMKFICSSRPSAVRMARGRSSLQTLLLVI